MAAKAIGAVGVAAAGYFAYSMASAPAVEPAAKLTKEQQKTRNLRSHLSGNHPKVSGGDDCLSRGQGHLKSRISGNSSSDTHDGEGDRRQAVDGTVSVSK
mmetsp:Transcript_45373/g.106534  ORF Transcript_45373/g.106534 Transcript_45373/m.106534 type:complete len:100 (-) Transcript_45373:39-338(-)